MKILKNSDKRCKGFTLVEIQIAMLIGVILFIATFSIYIMYSKTFTAGSIVLDVYSNSRIAIALMARDIRCASQVEASNGSYVTTDSCIVLKVPSVDSSGNTIGAKYDEIIYRLQGTSLYRIVVPSSYSARHASNRAVAYHCASLTFSSGGVTLSNISSANLSNINTVAVSLPINKEIISLSGAGTVIESMTPTTIIKMRNK